MRREDMDKLREELTAQFCEVEEQGGIRIYVFPKAGTSQGADAFAGLMHCNGVSEATIGDIGRKYIIRSLDTDFKVGLYIWNEERQDAERVDGWITKNVIARLYPVVARLYPGCKPVGGDGSGGEHAPPPPSVASPSAMRAAGGLEPGIGAIHRAAVVSEYAATVVKWLSDSPVDEGAVKAALVLARRARRAAGTLAEELEELLKKHSSLTAENEASAP